MSEHFDRDPGSGGCRAENNPSSPRVNAEPDQSGERAYWSQQDQRRAQDVPLQRQNDPRSNGYYPPPGYQQRGYAGYTPPYQYSANTGWQQPESRGVGKYEWRYEDYERSGRGGGKRKRNRGLVVVVVCVICVVVVGLVGISGYSIYTSLNDAELPAALAEAEQNPAAEGDTSAPAVAYDDFQLNITGKPEINDTIPVGGKMTIPQVAQTVSPSVVGVVKYQNAQFLEPTGMGSGIIMSDTGYIITNAHVVEQADTVVVYIEGEEETGYEAVIVGADAQTDLAVLKIEADNLTSAQFGNSDELEVGETVLAIGNPAGLELAGSVTQGIVSAVNRQVATSSYTMTYIQTDAAINPGNSGGPLVNEYGQVIGINSSKIAQVGYEGIGFAIPINDAEPIINDLISTGRVTGRVMLGISGETVNEIVANNYNVPMGVQILEITRGDVNELRKGDIITHIDGESTKTFDDIRAVLNKHKVGDTVTLTLYRQLSVMQNQTLEVDLVLIEDMGNLGGTAD